MNEIQQLKKEIDSLKRASTIPLSIDQAFRERFKIGRGKILYTGLFTTVGGDSTENIIGLIGVQVNDVAIVTINTVGGTPRTVTAAVCAADSITVTMSGNPSSDHVLNYMVLRQ